MDKKEKTKSPLYSVGQEIIFGANRGGISTAKITKVGRKYAELNSRRLRLDMTINKVVSKEGDWTYRVYSSMEEYKLEVDTNKAWDKLKEYFGKPHTKPNNLTLETMSKILKTLEDEVQ